tara:strand:- start:1890 stop:2432 length:543 start_codon:yes stop_codon:yes gene_type:complete
LYLIIDVISNLWSDKILNYNLNKGKVMNIIKYTLIALLTSFCLSNIALAKSGTINFHTGWSGDVTALPVNEDNLMGVGVYKGATFNDNGSGYLHNGEGQCFASFVVHNGVGENKGWCAWADSDGDRLYTSFSGDTQKGINTIIGGTGKYTDMKGSGPWACYDLGTNGSNRCEQSINYTLP